MGTTTNTESSAVPTGDPDTVDIAWSPMFDVDGVRCATAQHGNEWLIATNASPYFCMSCVSREAAIEKARRAIAFWRRHKKADHQSDVSEPQEGVVHK